MVCESDGVRVLLFITDYIGKLRGYFHNRKNDFYERNIDSRCGSADLLNGEGFFGGWIDKHICDLRLLDVRRSSTDK